MKKFDLSKRESGFHVEGFPDAVKVIAIEGPQSKRLADLALHRGDLEFADGCLDAINLSPEKPFVIREALWRSAIVHFIKCFGNSEVALLGYHGIRSALRPTYGRIGMRIIRKPSQERIADI